MTPSYPKRLIEVDLPIKRISAHARREKTTHHGHISTLHIWWARRPLAACRAVICASLWPDPADPLCPQDFRDKASKIVSDFAKAAASSKELGGSCDPETWIKWQALTKTGGLDSRNEAHLNILRFALLDFIADFANWDNSAVKEYLDASRALTQAAHEALGGETGTRPLVVDPFAGGGSIPLEALRVGADAFASDLNPIPVLLNKVVLEYIPKYGQRLADELRKWGEWIKKEAEKELAVYYPTDPDGATPIAYLWARTIRCEGPGCGYEIPMVRNMQLTREGRLWHYAISDKDAAILEFKIASAAITSASPTVAGGSVTCPRRQCGYGTPSNRVRAQLALKNGGANDARMLAVYVDGPRGRLFREPTPGDLEAVQKARQSINWENLPHDLLNTTRPYKNTRGLSAVTRIGIQRFADLYTSRQALALQCFQSVLLRIPQFGGEPDLRTAVISLLNCAASRLVFQNTSLSRWHAGRSTIEGAFGKQALQVVSDFAEVNPLSDGPANWNGSLEWVLKVIDANLCVPRTGTTALARAQDQLLPSGSVDALITDPPYFAAIPYGDLSNVFFVWERTVYRALFPELFREGLVDQVDEIIVTNANFGPGGRIKDAAFYEKEMASALGAARQAIRKEGIGLVVFAESNTSSWEAMLGAVIQAGWSVTGSWPIDTELQNRTQASGAASLQSSIHIVCRPRDGIARPGGMDSVGTWRDILEELPKRIHEWMPRLAIEGVVGADAIFACLGPALEVFSRYSRVEKASGEQVTLKEYLEHVWAAVAKEALAQVFKGADATGFEPDARLTAMWLWTLNAPVAGSKVEDSEEEDSEDEEQETKKPKMSGFKLEYDTARKIAQGLGAVLENLTHLVEVKGDEARLLPVTERTRHLFGKEEEEPARAARKKASAQMNMFAELTGSDNTETAWQEKTVKRVGETTLDRVHQAMILFAAGRGEALKRFVVDDSVGQDGKFWRLADALNALYPAGSEERRWVEGVLARKKSFGF